MLSNNAWKILLCAAACGIALTGSRVAYGAHPAQASLLAASPSHAAMAGLGQGEQESQEPPFEVLPVSPGIVKEFIHPDESDSGLEFHFSPDGSQILAGTYPGATIVVWDVETGVELTRIQAEGRLRGRGQGNYFRVSADWTTVYAAFSTYSSETFEEDGERKVRVDVDGSVKAWDLATGRVKQTYKHNPPRGILGMDLTPDGKHFATFEYMPGVFPLGQHFFHVASIWVAKDGTYKDAPDGLSIVSGVTSDGKFIMFPRRDYELQQDFCLFDPVEMNVNLRISLPRNSDETVTSTTPDSKLLVGYTQRLFGRQEPGAWAWETVWWDAATGRELNRNHIGFDVHATPEGYSPDGQWMALTDRRARRINLFVFRTADQSIAHKIPLEESTDEVRCNAQRPVFSPDGEWAIVCVNRYPRGFVDVYDPNRYPQPRIYIINVERGEIAKTLIAPQGWAVDPKFSPDGKFFAVSEFRKVTLWNWAEMIEGLE